jgi:hypothetical protein
MEILLGLNGATIEASNPEVIGTMLAVASGTMSEEALAEWLEAHVIARADEP